MQHSTRVSVKVVTFAESGERERDKREANNKKRVGGKEKSSEVERVRPSERKQKEKEDKCEIILLLLL